MTACSGILVLILAYISLSPELLDDLSSNFLTKNTKVSKVNCFIRALILEALISYHLLFEQAVYMDIMIMHIFLSHRISLLSNLISVPDSIVWS